MKPVLALVVLLVFGVPSVAAPPSAPAIDESKSIIVPVEILDGVIFVKAVINGQNARLIVDTGTSNIILTPEFARKVGWKGEGEEAEVNGVGGTAKARWMKLDTMNVEGLKLEGESLGAWVIPSFTDLQKSLTDLQKSPKADGLIGYQLFYSLVVTIDYTNSRLIFTRPEDFQAPGEGLPLRLEDGMPAVEAVLDGRRVWLKLDTGSSTGMITLNTPFVEREKLRQKYSPHYSVPIGGGVGGQSFGDVARGKTLTLGSYTIRKPLVYLSTHKSGARADKETDGTISNPILMLFNMTYDYGRKRLYLTPNADLTKPTFNLTIPGFTIGHRKSQRIIGNVLPGGPGAQAGLKNGDEILAINDVPLAKLRGKTLHWAAGEKIKFLLRRKPGGKPFTATVVIRNLL